MIRKTIIVVLTLAAVGASVLGTLSYVYPSDFQIARYDTKMTMTPGEQSIWLLMRSGKFLIGYKRILDAPVPLRRKWVPEHRLFGYASAIILTDSLLDSGS